MPTYTQEQKDSMARLKAQNAANRFPSPINPVEKTIRAEGAAFNPSQDLARDQAKYNATLKQTPTDPTTPQPKDPTVSDIYGSLDTPEYTQAAKDYTDLLKEDTAPIDESAIRQKTMDQFQAEIDAMNKIYAQKVAEERVAGEGRQGQTSAIQARRGLIGSDFGAAQTEKMSAYNQSLVDTINAEKANQIQQILGKARAEATKEIEAKKAARKQGVTDYLAYLKGAEERKNTRVDEVISNTLYSSIEADDNYFKELANTLGVDVNTVKAKYNKAKAAMTPEAKAPVTEKIGNTLLVYNPGTGKYEPQYVGPEEAQKPITQTAGKNLLQYNATTGNWDVVYTAPESAEDLKKVTINGVDYMQDSNGNLTTPVTPKAPTQERISQAEKIRDTAKEILASPEWNNAVGPLSSQWPEWMRSGERNAVDAKIKLLQGLLTLPNLGILKGPMSDKDIEFLKNASTAGLATNIDEKEFERIMKGIINDSKKVINNASTGGQVNQQLRAEVESTRKQLESEGYSKEEIDAAIKEEYPDFSQELQTSSNGNIQSPLALSIVQQESGGDYKAVGDVPKGYLEADRALGKYQIVPKYHFAAIGLENTPENRKLFLNSPQLQDKLFASIIGNLETQYKGDPLKVAAAYYGGAKAASIVGTPAGDAPQFAGGKQYPSINSYARSVVSRIA